MAESFDVVFRGTSRSECVEFIQAVRKYAKQNKKIRDNQWIADELYDAFAGEALLWYVSLPEDVQGDWVRLQEALITRWTKNDDVDNLSMSVSSLAILPTAAAAPPAAPPSNRAPFRTAPQNDLTSKLGRIRIRSSGVAGARYVCKDVVKDFTYWSGAFNTTMDAASALKVELITAAPNFYRLELTEHESGLSALAAFAYNSDDWNYKFCWGFFVGVDAPGQGSLKDRRTIYNGGNDRMSHRFWTDTWRIENMKLRGPGDTTGRTYASTHPWLRRLMLPLAAARFTIGIMELNKNSLWINGPKVQLNAYTEVEVDLEFEPLEN